ncbi:MAG: hypothetical protein ABL919_10450 [Methylococcales bacterium]|nr:hypothetical protein [Methylococcaceae bacterium]
MNINSRLVKLERRSCNSALQTVIVISPIETREQAIKHWLLKNNRSKLPEHALVFTRKEAKAVVAKLKPSQEKTAHAH